MEKFTILNKEFMYESLQDKLKDKLSEKYISLKRILLDVLEKNLKEETDELIKVQNLISSYTKDPEKNNLIGLVDDKDIYDIFLKCLGKNDIDDICKNNNYFDKSPTERNILSLYGYVIDGTKFAILEVLKIMEKELF